MKTIIHGTRNFGYALIDYSEKDPKFLTPKFLPGITAMTIEVEEKITPVYADNETFGFLHGAKVRTAEATVLHISEDYADACLGMKKHQNGMLTDTGEKATHGIFFESTETDGETGNETPTLHYLYACLATEPKVELQTDGEEVETGELVIPYTCRESAIALDQEGAKVQYAKIVRTPANASLYDTFKNKVLLPTDLA